MGEINTATPASEFADVCKFLDGLGLADCTQGGKWAPWRVKAVEDIDEEKRELTVTVTTGTRDRTGDIVDAAGALLENFKRNPVVLWSHDHTAPVGKALWIKAQGAGKNKVLKARVRFVPPGDVPGPIRKLADDVWSLYKDGFLKGWSIGFIPLDWEEFEENGTQGYHVKSWELVEFSAVAVPANPEALTNAQSEIMVKALTPPPTKAARPEGAWQYCVCDDCGYYEDHTAGEPCQEKTCPECGATLAPSDTAPEKEVDPKSENEVIAYIREHVVAPLESLSQAIEKTLATMKALQAAHEPDDELPDDDKALAELAELAAPRDDDTADVDPLLAALEMSGVELEASGQSDDTAHADAEAALLRELGLVERRAEGEEDNAS